MRIDFEIDWKFWALIPNFNLNFHQSCFTFEIEWLCFALYMGRANWPNVSLEKAKKTQDVRRTVTKLWLVLFFLVIFLGIPAYFGSLWLFLSWVPAALVVMYLED